MEQLQESVKHGIVELSRSAQLVAEASTFTSGRNILRDAIDNLSSLILNVSDALAKVNARAEARPMVPDVVASLTALQEQATSQDEELASFAEDLIQMRTDVKQLTAGDGGTAGISREEVLKLIAAEAKRSESARRSLESSVHVALASNVAALRVNPKIHASTKRKVTVADDVQSYMGHKDKRSLYEFMREMENLARRRGVPLELDDLASHVTDFALDIYEIALAENPNMTLVGFKQRLFTTFANDTLATIRSKFYNCRKAKDETFGVLASKLRRIALSWDMAGYADPPGPEMVLQTFLAALITGKHRGMVEAIQDASDTSRWTLLQWITKLESRVHNKGAEVSATHAHETGGSSGKSKKKKGKKARADSSDKPDDTKEPPKKDGRTCRLCKKVGHIQYNCPEKNKSDKPSNTNFSQMSWLLCSVGNNVDSLPTRDLLIESETRLERALNEQDYRLPSRPHDTGAGKRVWIRAECGPWLVDPGALLSSVVDEKSAAELPGPIYPMAPEDAHVRATTMTGDASSLGWKVVVVRVPGVTHLKGRAKKQKKVSVH